MAHFDSLSDVDFEDLVGDVLTAEHRRTYRSYAKGRDRGIDLVGETQRGGRHAVQVAHFPNSTFAHLLAKSKAEKKKLDKSRETWAGYWFVTSMPLSRSNIEKLTAELQPYIKSENHILSGPDVRRLLRKHEHVAMRHVKSWIPESATLMRALRQGAFSRSDALIAESLESLPIYVETGAFQEASRMLDDRSVCIISGAPGIGKTTLARMLLLDHASRGVKPFELAANQLDDAWSILDLDEPQIFYYDDFLGRTALIRLREDEKHLLRFMNEVAKRDGKSFILTTREYVLNKAVEESETLAEGIRRDRKYLLELSGYSEYQRGRILYNHVYHAPHITQADRQSLLFHRAYATIISHKNYSPRLIGNMASESLMAEISGTTFAARCIRVLESPDHLWRKPFEKGLGQEEKALLIALVGLESAIEWSKCQEVFEAACRARNLQVDGSSFEGSLHVLQDSFLRIAVWPDREPYIDFLNPSIQDFLQQYLVRSPLEMERAIESISSYDQVGWLWDFAEGVIGPSTPLQTALQNALARSFDTSLLVASPLATSQHIAESAIPQLTLASEICRGQEVVADELLAAASKYVEPLLKVYEKEYVYLWPTVEIAAWLHKHGKLSRRKANRIIDLVRTRQTSWLAMEYVADAVRNYPDFVPQDTFESMQAELALDAQEILDDPAGHLDDMDEFERFEDVVNGCNLPVSETRFATARGEMEDHEMANAEPEPDYDYDPTDYWQDADSSPTAIDDLFSRFA